MEVYIKDMNIPKSCWSCDIPLSILKCPVQTEEEAMRYCSCRHKGCPIIIVPPHVGDLIDRAVLADSFEPSDFWNSSAEDNCFAAIHITNSMPTVIPAEENIDIQKEFMQNWHEEDEE